MKSSQAFEEFFNEVTAKYPDMVPTNTHKELLWSAFLHGQNFELEKAAKALDGIQPINDLSHLIKN